MSTASTPAERTRAVARASAAESDVSRATREVRAADRQRTQVTQAPLLITAAGSGGEPPSEATAPTSPPAAPSDAAPARGIFGQQESVPGRSPVPVLALVAGLAGLLLLVVRRRPGQ